MITMTMIGIPMTQMDQQMMTDQQTVPMTTTPTSTTHPRHHAPTTTLPARTAPARRMLCMGQPHREATAHLRPPRDRHRPPVPSCTRPAAHMRPPHRPPRLPTLPMFLPLGARRTHLSHLTMGPHMTHPIPPCPSHRRPHITSMHTAHPMPLRMLHHMLHTTCKRAHKRGSMGCACHCMLHHHHAPPTPPQQLHNLPPGRTAWAAASQQHVKRSVTLGSTCKRW